MDHQFSECYAIVYLGKVSWKQLNEITQMGQKNENNNNK